MSLKRFVKVIPVILAISITCNVSTASVSAASLTTQSKSNAIIYKSAHDVYTEKSVLQNIDKQITPGYIYVDGVKMHYTVFLIIKEKH